MTNLIERFTVCFGNGPKERKGAKLAVDTHINSSRKSLLMLMMRTRQLEII